MKDRYTVKEDGFQAYWFEGAAHRDRVVIWMHGSGMNEKRCLADSEYLRGAGYSVLFLGFYFWKGMSRRMRAIPVEYVERAVAVLKRNGFDHIGIHGISSGAACALLCASLIPDIRLVLSICPFEYVMEAPEAAPVQRSGGLNGHIDGGRLTQSGTGYRGGSGRSAAFHIWKNHPDFIV